MPKFVNKTSKPFSVILNGRKISIPAGGEIEGPEHLSMYKQLSKVNDAVKIIKKEPEIKINNKIDRVIKKHEVKAISISNQEYINKPINVYSENYDIFSFNLKTTITSAKNYINNYNKNNLPSVGICILTKNSYELITECVQSILTKVKYKNTKIYIFDTGTTEEKVLLKYEAWKKNGKIPFEVINVGNFHFSQNYNRGINKVSTDYVVIQNNDTVALNDYVSNIMKFAILDKVGISGPRMLYKDMRIQHDGQILYDHANKKFINPGHLHLGVPADKAPKGRKRVDGITGAGMFIKTSLYKQLGGLNENYLDIYQDVEINIEARMRGYSIICDWNSLIHHYDNTSRKSLWKNNEQVAKMWKDSNYLHRKILNKELFYQPRKRFKLSIVTLVNNLDQYNNFLDDLNKQENYSSFELIPLPNFNNEYKGCSEALNIGLDLSDSEFTILCHQDLRLPTDWLEQIEKRIDELKHIKWGVLGMAGAIYNGKIDVGATYLNNKFDDTQTCRENSFKAFGEKHEVQCLDELCLIVKSDSPIRFDEKIFDHYHLYGSDFCLQYLQAGYRNFAIDAPCEHLSDGFSNLKNEKHRERYLEDTKKLVAKWKNNFPYFRNMTAAYDNVKGEARIYTADALKQQGYNWSPLIKI